MDFIFGLPKTRQGHDGVLVVCDRFSKMAHFIPTNEHVDAGGTARLLMRHVILRYGLSQSIISDRDPHFVSKFWRTLFNKFGTKIQLSTSYHPQTDGQTERTNQTLEQMLRCTLENHAQWDDLLDVLEFAYNATPSASTKTSPYEAVYGRPPVSPLGFAINSNLPRVNELLANFQEVWRSTHDNLKKAQVQQKLHADKARGDTTFVEGDQVMLATTNLKLDGYPINKLKPRWLGPFTIIEKVSDVVYRLQLPDSMKIHPTFHVSLLKRYINSPSYQDAVLKPPPVVLDGDEEFEVERILGHRRHRRGVEYLVRWKGYGPEEDSWEPEAHLQNAPQVSQQYRRQEVIIKASREDARA